MNKETDSIIRYCKPTQIQDDQVCASAFFLRKKNIDLKRPEDEKELSVHQFEFFPNDSLKNLKEYLQNNNFNLKPEGCFAKIKYSEHFKKEGTKLGKILDSYTGCMDGGKMTRSVHTTFDKGLRENRKANLYA